MAPKSLAILLAVYDPPADWFAELLDSLNAQTYGNLHLYVRDDASPHTPSKQICAMLDAHISAFPWTYRRNDVNLGSNKTFEALLLDASEDYIAFCDQDDVWLPEKLSTCVSLLENSPLSPVLVGSNASVIDGDGREIAPVMEQHRRRHVFLRGEGLARELFFRNFVIGCTIVSSRERLVSYLPIPDIDGLVHDHYLAFRAACDGAIDYPDTPLMRYRVYGGNQTGVMSGVVTKDDYYRLRIKAFADRLAAFSSFAPDSVDLSDIRAWSDARERNFRREKGSFSALFRLRHCNKSTTLFELVALRLPYPLFRLAVKAVQKRMV